MTTAKKTTELKPVFAESSNAGLMVMSSGLSIKKDSFFVTGDDVDSVLKSIKDEVSSYVADLSTAKGRAEVTKTVSIVTDCKTFLEAQGKELSAHHKTIPSKIDANRKKVKTYLTQLQADIRKPLTDWQEEQAEIKLQNEIKAAADAAQAERDRDHEIADYQYREYKDQCDIGFIESAAIENAIEEKRKADQKEREDEIAKQAAADAKLKAEQEAAAEILRANKQVADAKQKIIDDKIKSDRELLVAAAQKKALEDQAAQDKINSQWLAVLQEAHDINGQLDFDIEQKRLAVIAEQKRLADIETVRLNQIALQQAEDKRVSDEKAQRAADVEHARVINQGIVKGLQAAGLTYDDAVKAVKAMVKGIDNVTINY